MRALAAFIPGLARPVAPHRRPGSRRRLMRLNLFLIAAVIGAAAVPSLANAQAWQPIGERKANLSQRIDQGIRSGALNRAEARQLTRQLDRLVLLERRYRASRPGLTRAERRDLDRRYDTLSMRVRYDKHDRQTGY